MVVDVEQLYKSFGVLADKENPSEHKDSFQVLLDGVKGDTAAKRLSAQFISRFFKYFPDQSENSINALIDLCEDSNINVRKAAIKELPNLCKSDSQLILRLTDVLVQVLASEDTSELNMVNSALTSMFKMNVKATLTGVLSQIINGEDEVREKAINYLCKILKNPVFNLSKEMEVYVLEESKKVFEDVTGNEFATLMQGLSSLAHIQTISGRKQLIDMIADQMSASKDFDVNDSDDFNRVNQCIGTALTLCSKNVHGSRFINFISTKILPFLSASTAVDTSKEGAEDTSNPKNDQQLDLLKKLAELSNFCGNGESVKDCIPLIFDKLKEFMPQPPVADENGNVPNPELQFSYVECLLYSLHQLARNDVTFLSAENAAVDLKDFRLRLQYFARGTRVYINEIQASLAAKTSSKSKDEDQIKSIALKTCNNVNTIIKDLFRNPPSFKSVVVPSWKKPKSASDLTTTKALKRSNNSGDGVARKKKDDRTLYQVPAGKYSQSISLDYQPRGRGRNNQAKNGSYRY